MKKSISLQKQTTMKKSKSLQKQIMSTQFKWLFVFFINLLIISCNEKEHIENTNIDEQNLNNTELAYPNKSGEIKKGYYLGVPVTYEVIDDQYIIDGDIILPKNQVYSSMENVILQPGQKSSSKRSAGITYGKWPNNTVYYSIDPNLPSKHRATEAIQHWQNNTNLNFIERTNQPNYIYFYRGSGCSSSVGMQGGKQEISLADGCPTGAAIHEIGHAIGLFHEQSRTDRDNYVLIHEQNIIPNSKYNFYTYFDRGYRGQENTTFDFNSIMMYHPYSFSKNGNPTITKLNGELYQSQRDGLSNLDIQGINKMYPATGTDSETPTYTNGLWYTVQGLRVYRYHDLWWVKDNNGQWLQVVYRDNQWYYA
ncbi:Astacin (Peptidase family M12A) [Tenacibaculum ascidiaceicola]